jgi:hypothetical protein
MTVDVQRLTCAATNCNMICIVAYAVYRDALLRVAGGRSGASGAPLANPIFWASFVAFGSGTPVQSLEALGGPVRFHQLYCSQPTCNFFCL